MPMLDPQEMNTEALNNSTLVVLGYGSQGRAHALNLRDSGLEVIVGARPDGPSATQASVDGFEVRAPDDAARAADLLALLVPDMEQRDVYENVVRPNLPNGATLLFAHGFSVRYGQVQPRDDLNVVMVAPKGPGSLVRRQFEAGEGVPCLVAVHQDASGDGFDLSCSYAHGLGATRAGVLHTTFDEETETDLFGEQAVLCGGVTELATACWETLVEAGYSPEVAYFECLHELKLIVDLLYEGGLERMHRYVSDTAKYGDVTRGPRVIDDHVRANLRRILEEVRNGEFGDEWIREHRCGGERFRALVQNDLDHPIERTGAALRARMSFLPQESKSCP